MDARRKAQAGISIIEILIAVSVLLLILAVGIPAADRIRSDSQVGDVLATVERLSEACERHHRDTGRMAVEFSPTKNGEAYSDPRYHSLSISQSRPGWKGPYLARPVGLEDNPFGGPVYLQNNLSASPANGFRLAGSQGETTEGPGQFVVFYGVPEEIARLIDAQLDKGFADSEDWKTTGSVEWTDSGSGGLSIFLMERVR
ncbi:MAG: hypothetical protein R3F20_14465 [Planctomycetota bacterium]